MIDLSSKIKDLATKSVDIVAELDKELAAKNSSYEIGDFKVKASLSVVGGMSLDIHFVKTPTSRLLADTRARNLLITNPQTGKRFNVPRTSLVGQEKSKVKDPHNGDILLIESETGRVVGIKKNASGNR
jgi:hypothetical protein